MDVTFTYLEYVTPGMTSPSRNKVGPFLAVFRFGGVMPAVFRFGGVMQGVTYYRYAKVASIFELSGMQGNFRAENSNMDVTFAYLEYVTPGMTSPNPNTGKKGPTL